MFKATFSFSFYFPSILSNESNGLMFLILQFYIFKPIDALPSAIYLLMQMCLFAVTRSNFIFLTVDAIKISILFGISAF